MSKLYTHISEEYAEYSNDCAEYLRNNEPQMHTYLEELADYAEYLNEFAKTHSDLMEDSRDGLFATEDFTQSREMEKLEADAEEILRLIYAINWKIGHVSQCLENLDVEYSEELDKLYAEERKYDYERA